MKIIILILYVIIVLSFAKVLIDMARSEGE